MRKLVFVCAAALLSLRLFALIYFYAVNVLFWDQWDLYRDFINNTNIIHLFVRQHGPHRQGIGYIITWIVSLVSHWDVRAEEIVIGLVVTIAFIGACVLKRILIGNITVSDGILALLFFNLVQFETFIGQTNISHSAMPLLLIVVYCLNITIKKLYIKYALLLFIDFLLVFTGFGFFIGIITPILLFGDLIYGIRHRERNLIVASTISIITSLILLGSFFIHYVFNSAIGCFVFPYPEYWNYPRFMALMFGMFTGLQRQAGIFYPSIIGGSFFILTLVVMVHQYLWIIRDNNPLSKSIFVLAGFTILFSTNTAIGRICAGLEFAQSSRYMTLMVPGFLAIYLFLLRIEHVNIRIASICLLAIMLLPSLLPLRFSDNPEIGLYYESKRAWRECFLKTEDMEGCNKKSILPIYPEPVGHTLDDMLAYMKQYRLNIYK